jgi:cytochrome P450
MAAYMLIEMIHDPSLLSRVHDELGSVAGLGTACTTELDVTALCNLPLLNSVYKECLRLRASIPLTRRLNNDIEIDGYTLRAGNFILAPSWLSHQDEKIWSVPDHPANVFWAERFMHNKEAVKAGDFFPYGGGNIICPGRFFAKQEILAAVAMIITSFDLAFVKNVHLDGTTSQRGPGIDDCESRGIISLDRDVVVRMRRRVLEKVD